MLEEYLPLIRLDYERRCWHSIRAKITQMDDEITCHPCSNCYALLGMDGKESAVVSNATLEAIKSIANEHINLSEDELERLLDNAWIKAGLIGKVPVRGGKGDIWRRVRARLETRASTESESISVLMGMIASDTIKWVSSIGVPVEKYEYPVGLLVAWVTLAAIKKYKKPQDPEIDSSKSK